MMFILQIPSHPRRVRVMSLIILVYLSIVCVLYTAVIVRPGYTKIRVKTPFIQNSRIKRLLHWWCIFSMFILYYFVHELYVVYDGYVFVFVMICVYISRNNKSEIRCTYYVCSCIYLYNILKYCILV